MMVFRWFWRKVCFRLGYFGLDLSDIDLSLKLDSEIDVISEEVFDDSLDSMILSSV